MYDPRVLHCGAENVPLGGATRAMFNVGFRNPKFGNGDFGYKGTRSILIYFKYMFLKYTIFVFLSLFLFLVCSYSWSGPFPGLVLFLVLFRSLFVFLSLVCFYPCFCSCSWSLPHARAIPSQVRCALDTRTR